MLTLRVAHDLRRGKVRSEVGSRGWLHMALHAVRTRNSRQVWRRRLRRVAVLRAFTLPPADD